MIRTKDLVAFIRKLPFYPAEEMEYRAEIVARLKELDELRGQMKAVKDCLQNRGK